MNLNEMLDNVVRKRAEAEELELKLKVVNEELKNIEGLAAEALAASGLDRVTYAGRTWRIEQRCYLNVPRANRDAVLQAAHEEGIADELTTVNTATLKSWLAERRNETGGEGPLSSGTAFEGLVSEYTQSRLRSRAV